MRPALAPLLLILHALVAMMSAPALAVRVGRSTEGLAATLTAFKDAALEIQQRFHKEQLDQNFGVGLPQRQVEEITRNSDEFWNAVASLDEGDVADLSDSDAYLAQKLVNEVARMDEDLDDPQRLDKVVPEYQSVVKELHDLGLSD
jgi:hypothetical protein